MFGESEVDGDQFVPWERFHCFASPLQALQCVTRVAAALRVLLLARRAHRRFPPRCPFTGGKPRRSCYVSQRRLPPCATAGALAQPSINDGGAALRVFPGPRVEPLGSGASG